MPYHTYAELDAEAMACYRRGAFGEALDLLTREGDAFPERAIDVLYMRSCMAARSGQPAQAIAILQDVLDRGLWYGHHFMRETPSWAPLQGLPAFEAVVAECAAREAAAQGPARFFVATPDAGCTPEHPCPALIALHGNMSTGPAALAGWQPAVADGWLLAALQSSQIGHAGAYIWDEQDTALHDLATQFATLPAEYALDPQRLVLAGFSLGGETALRAALQATIPARGFVLLGPGGPTIDTPDAWLPDLPAAADRGLRGYIFLGADDLTVPHAEIRRLVTLLNEHGIPCALEELPGLQHDYPPDFGPRIRRALAFVLGPAPTG